jgi:hypothetical protein
MKIMNLNRSFYVWIAAVTLSILPSLSFPAAVLAHAVTRREASQQQKEKVEQKKIGFDFVLERLSERCRCAILVEGWPIKDEVDPATLPPIFHSEQEKMRPEDAAKILEMFDYSVEQRRNVLLLRKRYSSPDDLPAITIEEARDAVRDVQTVISPFFLNLKRGGASSDPAVKQFITSLAPEQLAAMADPSKGLPLSDLSPEQRAATWRVSLHFYTGRPERAIQAVQHQLTCASKDELYIGWPKRSSSRVFGYGFPASSGTGDAFRHLTHETGRIGLDGSSFMMGGVPSAPPGTLGVPGTGAAPRTDKNRDPARLPPVSTLREQVDALNIRSGEQPGALTTAVDDSVAAKPVYLVGGKYATPTEALRGLVDLFSLRLVKSPRKEEQRMTRHKVRPVQRPEDIPEGVLAALPAPLLRAFSAESPRTEEPGVTPSSESPLQRSSLFRKRLLTEKHRAAMRAVAARRVREAFDEIARLAPVERVPIGRFDPQTRSAFALMLMNDCLSEMEQLLGPAPPYIGEFNNVVLAGGPDGKGMFTVRLQRRPAEGKVRQTGPMFGGGARFKT